MSLKWQRPKLGESEIPWGILFLSVPPDFATSPELGGSESQTRAPPALPWDPVLLRVEVVSLPGSAVVTSSLPEPVPSSTSGPRPPVVEVTDRSAGRSIASSRSGGSHPPPPLRSSSSIPMTASEAVTPGSQTLPQQPPHVSDHWATARTPETVRQAACPQTPSVPTESILSWDVQLLLDILAADCSGLTPGCCSRPPTSPAPTVSLGPWDPVL